MSLPFEDFINEIKIIPRQNDDILGGLFRLPGAAKGFPGRFRGPIILSEVVSILIISSSDQP